MDKHAVKRILVADDDDDILSLVAFRLERSGYEVIKAHDGEQALRLVREKRPALAVLDVMMPKLNGYEVTRKIRTDAALSQLPVILLTARAQDSEVDAGHESGADDYIKKPFSPQDLTGRVEALVGC